MFPDGGVPNNLLYVQMVGDRKNVTGRRGSKQPFICSDWMEKIIKSTEGPPFQEYDECYNNVTG